MIRAVPFGKLPKIWAMFWGNPVFVFFLVCSADAVSGSLSHDVQLQSFFAVISAQDFQPGVCVNSEQPLVNA